MADEVPENIGTSGTASRQYDGSEYGSVPRAMILDRLRRANGPVVLAELACDIVAEMSDRNRATVPHEQIQRVYLVLVRQEVPALEQRGIVEYSRDDGTLRLAGPGTP